MPNQAHQRAGLALDRPPDIDDGKPIAGLF
jgi:hypothetical protein